MKRSSILFAALLLLTPLAASADTLPIVEKSIEHHGGERYASSDTSFRIVSRSGAFRVEARQDGGLYRYAVIQDTDDGERTVVATNDDVEILVDGEPQPVPAEDEQRWRDFVSARVYFPFLPYRLDDPSVRQEDLGLETWPVIGSGDVETGEGERELHKVKVTFEEGSSTEAQDEYLYWFDPETGRLEQLAYSFRGGLRFRVAEDYRRVGGLLFADHENYGVDWKEGQTPDPVDAITPEYVREEMEHISTVKLEDVKVEGLE